MALLALHTSITMPVNAATVKTLFVGGCFSMGGRIAVHQSISCFGLSLLRHIVFHKTAFY